MLRFRWISLIGICTADWIPERNIFRSLGDTAVFQCQRPGGNTLGWEVN